MLSEVGRKPRYGVRVLYIFAALFLSMIGLILLTVTGSNISKITYASQLNSTENVKQSITDTVCPVQTELEGESGYGDGDTSHDRSNASGGNLNNVVWLKDGESRSWPFTLDFSGIFATVTITYSNDNHDLRSGELVTITLDGMFIDSFSAEGTSPPGICQGCGWNIFTATAPIDIGYIPNGDHTISAIVSGGDGDGIEIDVLKIRFCALDMETYLPLILKD